MAGCQVLSPHRLEVLDPDEAFIKDKAEASLTPEQIEQHHLLALTQADFVWLHSPAGHIGPSAAFEVGYALAQGKPVFSKTLPQEEVFRSFVNVVPSVFMALERLGTGAP
jgi:nucleoside 2-deoxyribosyltransferase